MRGPSLVHRYKSILCLQLNCSVTIHFAHRLKSDLALPTVEFALQWDLNPCLIFTNELSQLVCLSSGLLRDQQNDQKDILMMQAAGVVSRDSF